MHQFIEVHMINARTSANYHYTCSDAEEGSRMLINKDHIFVVSECGDNSEIVLNHAYCMEGCPEVIKVKEKYVSLKNQLK